MKEGSLFIAWLQIFDFFIFYFSFFSWKVGDNNNDDDDDDDGGGGGGGGIWFNNSTSLHL